MATREPEDGGTPEDPSGASSIPDEVWQRFLADSERAIRSSAPKEPSAEERTGLMRLRPIDPGVEREHADHGRHVTGRQAEQDRLDAVGELWQPAETTPGPAWRDMDRQARRRRVGRVLGTVAAAIVVLGTASHSAGSGTPSESDGEATATQSEDVADTLPTATAGPTFPALAPDPAPPLSQPG